MLSLKTAFAGALGALAVGKLLKDSVEAFGVQEKAVANLRDALEAAGDAGATSLPGLEKFASSLQAVTTKGDESTLQLAAYISTLGNLSGKSLEQATLASLALGRATNSSAETMAKAVLQFKAGDTALLQRYIPSLKTATTQGEKMALVNDLIQRGLRQLKSDANTTGGAWEQLGNTWGDVQETIGQALAPALKSIAQILKDAMPYIQSMAEGFSSMFNNILDWAGQFSSQFKNIMGDLAFFMDNVGDTVLSGVLRMLQSAGLTTSSMDALLSFTDSQLADRYRMFDRRQQATIIAAKLASPQFTGLGYTGRSSMRLPGRGGGGAADPWIMAIGQAIRSAAGGGGGGSFSLPGLVQDRYGTGVIAKATQDARIREQQADMARKQLEFTQRMTDHLSRIERKIDSIDITATDLD